MIDHHYGVGLRRLIRMDDAPSTFHWRNSDSIMKWCRQRDPLHWDDHLEWFDRQRTDPSIEMFGIQQDDLGFVGVAGLTDVDHVNKRAEFSLYIAPEHQKKGLGFKALSTLFEHGFSAYGLNIIWGETFEGNPAVVMFEKLGMKHDGVRREFYFKGGLYFDAHLYSITAEEWMDND